MKVASLKSFTLRPPVVLAALLAVALLAFFVVNRLVNRFREQEKALARHLYSRGLQALQAGDPEEALEDFRAALSYSHDDFQYQLSLARALRDTGRTAEAETYLISLWERTPQEGPVNLALGRLFAREQRFDKAAQYYHNAIYGFWASDPDVKRRDAQFELIEFLLQHKAYLQAQAELISLASAVPGDATLRLRVAELFTRAQDHEHALAEYQQILQTDPGFDAALVGAGQTAFQLGRYRTAQRYLQTAVRSETPNAQVRMWLDAGMDLSSSSAPGGLPSLKAQWLRMKPKLAKLPPAGDGALDQLMDLVYEIEQQTQAVCGSPDGLDQALLLLSQDRAGVER
jgi:tetratricopeptide (TPR) repeat protein